MKIIVHYSVFSVIILVSVVLMVILVSIATLFIREHLLMGSASVREWAIMMMGHQWYVEFVNHTVINAHQQVTNAHPVMPVLIDS
jgi:hypothetical protein